MFFIFFKDFKKIYKDKINGYEIILFLIPFLIHSLLEYPFRYLYFLVLIIPIFSLIGNLKIFYIRRSIFILIFFTYIVLLILVYVDFENYSRGAFFAQNQKCEIEKGETIVLDLMGEYSQLYCNTLSQIEMERVVYRYSYPLHIQYYIDKGYYNENFNHFE